MRILDLSQPMFDGAPNCPGHPPVRMPVIADHAEGGWRMELLEAATHTGSHLDAPFHRLAGGRTLDTFPLETFAAVPAYIADVRNAVEAGSAIGAELLASRLPEGDSLKGAAVLLATGWGDRRAKTEEWLHRSPYLSPEGAAYLVGRGVAGVGIDHYSVGGGGEINERTHEVLLGAGLWILEELHFPEAAFVLPQPVSLWALPINLGPGVSGAFCRPVLVVEG